MPYDYRSVTLPERGDKPYDQILLPALHWMIDQIMDSANTREGFIFPISVTALDSGTAITALVKPDGYSISEFTTTSTNVRLDIVVHNGSTAYMPSPTVNGVPFVVNLYQGEWKGTADVDISGISEIVLDNGLGVTWRIGIVEQAKPQITSFVFTGSYPGAQVELKQGDSFAWHMTTSVAVKSVEFADYGASGAATSSISNLSDFTGSITAADRGTVRSAHGVRVRVKDVFDTYSDWLTVEGSSDMVDVLYLNNVRPTMSLAIQSYPAGQSALKNSEKATLLLTAADYDSMAYSSPNGDLDISAATVGTFDVTRISGSYNVGTVNFVATATRIANGSTNSRSVVVKIANVAPAITVTSPARMRSGVSPQNYTISLSSTQTLASAPILNNVAGTGTLGGFGGSGTAWTASYTVPDSATKGTFAWTGLVATGLSGLTATTITTGQNYTVGGFTMRVLSVPAWPTRSVSIGTTVVDTSKLRCTNLSKGTSGSYNFTYQAGLTGTPDRYTITGGNTWYNCDTANASSNTSSMLIELEETA